MTVIYDEKPLSLVETLAWLVKRDDLNEGDKVRYDELRDILEDLDQITAALDDYSDLREPMQ